MEPEVALARLEERVRSLESWQESQNGTLRELAAKIDRLLFFLLAEACGIAATLAAVLLKG